MNTHSILRLAPVFLLAAAQSACVFGTSNNTDSGADADAASPQDTGSQPDVRDAAPGVDATCYADAGDVLTLAEFDGGTPIYNDGTAGTRNRLQFVFESGDLFSSFPLRPMLQGTHEIVTGFRNDILPRLGAVSSDPSVVAVTGVVMKRSCCVDTDAGASCTTFADTPPSCMTCSGRAYSQASVSVQAAGAGSATITLRDEGGSEYDSIALNVEPATTLRAFQVDAVGGTTEVTSLTANHGDTLRVQVFAYGSDGMQIEARYGVTMTAADASVAMVREHTLGFSGFGTSIESYDVDVYAAAAGSTTLSVTANGASITLPLTVQ